MSDGSWRFGSSSFSSAPRSNSRYYSNFNFLSVEIAASRVPTSGVVMLLLPGITICVAQVMSYFFPMKSDGRMTVGITGVLATVAFNWIILQVSPAVAYMTKMVLLSMCCILLCLLNVLIQSFFRSVFSAVELLRKVFSPEFALFYNSFIGNRKQRRAKKTVLIRARAATAATILNSKSLLSKRRKALAYRRSRCFAALSSDFRIG